MRRGALTAASAFTFSSTTLKVPKKCKTDETKIAEEWEGGGGQDIFN